MRVYHSLSRFKPMYKFLVLNFHLNFKIKRNLFSEEKIFTTNLFNIANLFVFWMKLRGSMDILLSAAAVKNLFDHFQNHFIYNSTIYWNSCQTRPCILYPMETEGNLSVKFVYAKESPCWILYKIIWTSF